MLGRIIEDLQKCKINPTTKEIKVEESRLDDILEEAEFTDCKIETSDIDFESTSEIEEKFNFSEQGIENISTNKRNEFLREELKSSQLDRSSCDNCEETFESNVDYEKHQRLCTLARSFNCDLCDKSFPSEYGLNCHMGRKHPDSLTNLICDICGTNFDNKKDFKAHKHVFKTGMLFVSKYFDRYFKK